MKRLIFRFSPAIVLLTLVIGAFAIFHFDLDGKPALLGALIAVVLGFCYFVQQQRLAETRLFKELFTDFNHRYDLMNGRLGEIVASGTATDKQIQLIVDYLNLCAEEYLFFRQGYIVPEVWTAWCRGMLQYLNCEPFLAVWRKELTLGSYYGLTEALVRQRAA